MSSHFLTIKDRFLSKTYILFCEKVRSFRIKPSKTTKKVIFRTLFFYLMMFGGMDILQIILTFNALFLRIGCAMSPAKNRHAWSLEHWDGWLENINIQNRSAIS